MQYKYKIICNECNEEWIEYMDNYINEFNSLECPHCEGEAYIESSNKMGESYFPEQIINEDN